VSGSQVRSREPRFVVDVAIRHRHNGFHDHRQQQADDEERERNLDRREGRGLRHHQAIQFKMIAKTINPMSTSASRVS
jgi:hypothetical protein